jgi:uncharacterized phage-associated protein
MANPPIQMNEMMRLYNRVAKLKPSSILEHEQGESLETVNTSTDAKKRQVLEQARTEVLDRIREDR